MTDNHVLAIKWASEQLAKNNFSNLILLNNCEKIENPKLFLETQIDRLMFGCELEKKVSYRRIKQLKDKLTNDGN